MLQITRENSFREIGCFINMSMSSVFQYLARKYLENLQNANLTEEQNKTKNLGKINQSSWNVWNISCNT